ncbi:rhomboid family intramembrane serine protease [Fibrella forsythiae]|uniref:Rhomboid family intramembrane serine protease n=1 Tax=Fibrella forsythiae TaxID=2817061 RepID=A0ABS3JLS4_9BACT|nr:rhomboid family intramembrane serine protease [Fibrella forsythiae]MBO0950964.1 rhomboid family intramembrane serine protease [Fibrella forsythiae]
MASYGSIGLLLVVVTSLITFSAFRRASLLSRYAFSVEGILIHKEYGRLISSGFVHADWKHLLFNMYSLMAFAGTLEQVAGPLHVLIIYFASLVGGNLLALFINRNNTGYRAVGASGAIAGIIFAVIVLFPGISINPLFMPFRIPAWIYGLFYTLFSIYGIKSRNDNIGHEAHLGGAVVGVLSMCAIEPAVLLINWPIALLLTLPAIAFLLFIVHRPDWLYINGFSLTSTQHETKDERYNAARFQRQQEIDRILDKINERGVHSLTEHERDVLEGR